MGSDLEGIGSIRAKAMQSLGHESPLVAFGLPVVRLHLLILLNRALRYSAIKVISKHPFRALIFRSNVTFSKLIIVIIFRDV